MSNNELNKQQLKLNQDALFFNPFFYRHREHCTDRDMAIVVKETNT